MIRTTLSFRSVMDNILRIGLSIASAMVPLQLDLFAVTNQIRRVKSMGMNLIVVTEEEIKAMFFRHACGIATTTAPLAEPARRVPLLLKASRRW